MYTHLFQSKSCDSQYYQQILASTYGSPSSFRICYKKTSITYRRSRSLKDTLVKSHFIEINTLPSPTTKGTFPCGGCDFCESLDTRLKVTLPGGYKWSPNHHVTCSTMVVIYLLQCTCNAYYGGKTRRVFNIRISKHIVAAKVGFFKTVIGRHIALTHNYAFHGLKFLPLTVIAPHDRGGDWDQALL